MEPKVSFIIPALNEERSISALLDSLMLSGTDIDFEVIVADGHSTDKTARIAREMGAKVIPDNADGPKTIANGRNTGASIASGELFVFCDADTILKDPEGFLAEITDAFRNPRLVAGAPKLKIHPDERKFKDTISHFIFNNIIRISFLTKSPVCGGQCQVVRSSAFRRINGYNSEIVHGEDTDLFRRLRKTGKLRFFSSQVVYESPRRYRHYGYVPLALMGAYSIVYQRIAGKNLFKEWKRVG